MNERIKAKSLTGSVSIPASQVEAMLAPLWARIESLEAAAKSAAGPMVARHVSTARPGPNPAVPAVPRLVQQFAYYHLPMGPKAGQVRVARITGQGTLGAGFANLRIDLNGDEGWGRDVLWLIVENAPYSLSGEPDTWRLGPSAGAVK